MIFQEMFFQRFRQFSRYYSLYLSVPKGSRTVNWVGESPDYILCKHETNRNTLDDRTNNSVAITLVVVDEGFEPSRDGSGVERYI